MTSAAWSAPLLRASVASLDYAEMWKLGLNSKGFVKWIAASAVRVEG
jgi:hypothetical protein